jgi:hypothetical protein
VLRKNAQPLDVKETFLSTAVEKKIVMQAPTGASLALSMSHADIFGFIRKE